MTHWIDVYCATLKGAVAEYQPDWQAMKYCVGGKMFAMKGEDKNGVPIITIKLKAENGERLRYLYPEQITAGYYMNKVHWNSFYYETDLSKTLIEDSLQEGYELILKSLSKKQREAILI